MSTTAVSAMGGTAGGAALGATTLEVDRDLLGDLVRAGGAAPDRRVWARHDLALLAVGQAARLAIPRPWPAAAAGTMVDSFLGAVAIAGDPEEPGTGPVALGALPFDPGHSAELVVPRLSVCRRRGRAWATLVAPGPPGTNDALTSLRNELQLLSRPVPDETLPDGFDLRASMSHDRWKQLISRTVAEMEAGRLKKVVMARRVDVVANRPFVLPETLARLAALYPSCTVFHVDGFIGASPELLVRRSGYEVASHPLAGTIARSGDATTDQAMLAGLMASPKERQEHSIVVDEISTRLAAVCSSLEVPPAPSVLMLRNVSHLGTPITGKLADLAGTARPATALQLAARLHPTPAVGGRPTEAALRWQRENEGFDRRCYAGPVGWVDSRGDGEWAVGVRSAHISAERAYLFAGNGIVAGSVPEAELAETQLKLQALLSALVRP